MVSKLRRIEMYRIDGSDTIRYGALLNGIQVVQMITNRYTNPHITLTEWYNIVKSLDVLKPNIKIIQWKE